MINSESREYVILVSHGSLAYGMKTAIEMICGNDMDIESYDLDHYKSPEEIYVILDNMVKENPDDKFIVFTDLLGGSVHNRLLGLALNEKVIIITGMHLGLVLSMLLDTIGTLEERAERAIESSSPKIVMYTKDKILEESEKLGKEDDL